MWAFIVLGILLCAGAIVIWMATYQESIGESLVIIGGWLLLGGFLGGLIAIWMAKATTGFYPGYSDGERIGYVTKVSYKGFIWKTYEIEVQIGTGDQAALQKPHRFSTTDKALADQLLSNMGKKGRFHYQEWVLVPFSVGSSDYELTKVDW